MSELAIRDEIGTKLLVTVDTEENWTNGSPARMANVSNVHKIQELQNDYFDLFSITPTYLVNYPVAADKLCVKLLKEMCDSARCEIGAHLHHWYSPPFTEADVVSKSPQCKLPYEVEKQKMKDVTDILEREIGIRPVSFRAGRWCADGETIRILAELGYKVDLSVVPLADYTPEGGMDFTDAPFEPYFPSFEDILKPSQDPAKHVLEIPVTQGFSRPDFEGMRKAYKKLIKIPRCLHIMGLLSSLNIISRIKLSPEASTFLDMKILVDACLKRKCKIIHISFHSCTNSVGNSPYSRTRKEKDARMKHLYNILEYVTKEKNIKSRTAKGIYEGWEER